MKKTIICIASVLAFAMCAPTAFAQEVSLGGQPVGIEVRVEGVLVAGMSEIESESGTKCPARAAGIEPGDIITEMDGTNTETIADVLTALEKADGKCVTVRILRGEKEMTFEIAPMRAEDGRWVLGMLLRDGISGIGTLTFYDSASGRYGALGHCVTDSETGNALKLGEGSILGAEIVGVVQGKEGDPGELKGCTDPTASLGSIDSNADCGIFGTAYCILGGEKVETGELRPGPAEIVTTVQGHDNARYSVNIDRVYTDSGTRRALITVTDALLIEITGGIVQGMSGSPIMQNGRIVGAVTHVYVEDPTKGCCIGIEEMLEQAGISAA